MASNSQTLEDYVKIEKIGEGTHGVVFKGRNKTSGEIVAMKKLRFDSDEDGLPATAIREISLLREMSHPNIVKLKEIVLGGDQNLYLIFEFLTMDLRKYIDSSQDRIDPRLVKSYTYQILQGTLYCHQRRIMHRDLKPANLLINREGTIKLADFGLARGFGLSVKFYTHQIVTLYYRAPEILLGSPKYSCPIDLWSIGTIFAEMLTRKILFQGDSEIDQILKIFKMLSTPTESVWPGVTSLPDFKPCFPRWSENKLASHLEEACEEEAVHLLQQFLVYDPSTRATARQALDHPYFKDLDKESLPAKPGEFEQVVDN